MSNTGNRYIVKKILNNNAVVSQEEDGNEVILFGRGVGFKIQSGMRVNPEAIYKVYELRSGNDRNKLETLLNEIPFDCIQLSEDIITYSQQMLSQKLNQNLVIALADHINFMVEQVRSGSAHPTLMSEEIRRFYRNEYGIGTVAVSMIEQHYQISLPESEAASIAFHLVNAQSQGDTDETTRIIQGSSKILAIIENELKIQPKEDSLSYSRLVSHVRYFMKRVLSKEKGEDQKFTAVFFNEEDEQYKRCKKCLNRIEEFLKESYDYEMNDEERIYLLIHITRVLQTN